MTAKFIDYRAFPQIKPEAVQALCTSIEEIALRINLLTEVRGSFQGEPPGRQLQEDLRSWRTALEALFHRWAENPIAEPAEDLQERLINIETRITQSFTAAGAETVSDEDYQNFYQLLGSYRGLSESVVAHAKLAGSIDWVQWKEARF